MNSADHRLSVVASAVSGIVGDNVIPLFVSIHFPSDRHIHITVEGIESQSTGINVERCSHHHILFSIPLQSDQRGSHVLYGDCSGHTQSSLAIGQCIISLDRYIAHVIGSRYRLPRPGSIVISGPRVIEGITDLMKDILVSMEDKGMVKHQIINPTAIGMLGVVSVLLIGPLQGVFSGRKAEALGFPPTQPTDEVHLTSVNTKDQLVK